MEDRYNYALFYLIFIISIVAIYPGNTEENDEVNRKKLDIPCEERQGGVPCGKTIESLTRGSDRVKRDVRRYRARQYSLTHPEIEEWEDAGVTQLLTHRMVQHFAQEIAEPFIQEYVEQLPQEAVQQLAPIIVQVTTQERSWPRARTTVQRRLSEGDAYPRSAR